jgi:hypothetical protein
MKNDSITLRGKLVSAAIVVAIVFVGVLVSVQSTLVKNTTSTTPVVVDSCGVGDSATYSVKYKYGQIPTAEQEESLRVANPRYENGK